MKINVQIERLVLDGINIHPHERLLLQAAFESELARLLTDVGLSRELSTGSALPSLSGAAIQISNTSTPERIGHQIAGAVYKGIGQ